MPPRAASTARWLLGIAPRFDCLVQIGMHAMGYTPNACLAHSMSKGIRYKANGREVGEMEMAACLAGHLGIPWVFTSGDAHACAESQQWVPEIATVAVKEGLGELCAIHLAPADARALLEKEIQQAVKNTSAIAPLVLQGPVEVIIEREEPWPTELKPGAERLDELTIRYTGDTFWRVFHHIFYGKPDFPVPA